VFGELAQVPAATPEAAFRQTRLLLGLQTPAYPQDLTECEEITPEMFAKAIVRQGLKPVERKAQVTLRLDSDIIGWFKSGGRGYQTRINSLLRAYVDEQRRHKAQGKRSGRVTSQST